MPIPWIELLRSELTEASPPLALATVDDPGLPHVRYVVCRKFDKQGNLWFVSDARSDKNHHLRTHPQAEAALWLPTKRTQFRIAGEVTIISAGSTDPRRSEAWIALSDASRALFIWPAPGELFQPDQEFSRGLPARSAIPESFELLILAPKKVEHLDLNQHPHRRRRWEALNDWHELEINP